MISEKLKAEIENDIKRCDEQIQLKSNSYKLYRELVIKYSSIDKDFQKGMANYLKTIGSEYVAELEEIKTKLKTYLLLDDIPITYNGNIAANAVTVNAKKINGNVGNGNISVKTTHNEANVKLEQKSGFWSKLISLLRRK